MIPFRIGTALVGVVVIAIMFYHRKSVFEQYVTMLARLSSSCIIFFPFFISRYQFTCSDRTARAVTFIIIRKISHSESSIHSCKIYSNPFARPVRLPEYEQNLPWGISTRFRRVENGSRESFTMLTV